MSIKDMIAGYEGKTNADDSFDPLKGKYECTVESLEVGTNQEGVEDRYKMTLKVTKTISGDKGDNRLFFKTYWKEDEKKVKQLIDDLFTMGVQLDTNVETDADFEAQFTRANGVTAYVNAYHFKPEKKMDGTLIPEDERKPLQIAKIYKPSDKKAGSTASTEEVPF